jgi:hypothetical protein
VLKWDVFSFGFLQVLSRIPLVVLGDPQGCPRQWPHWAGGDGGDMLRWPDVTALSRASAG